MNDEKKSIHACVPQRLVAFCYDDKLYNMISYDYKLVDLYM